MGYARHIGIGQGSLVEILSEEAQTAKDQYHEVELQDQLLLQ